MRKRKKEQLLSLLQSYEEAHSTLRSFITEGREKEATSLLVLCQEGMEKIEGEVRANLAEADGLTALFLQYQEALFRTYQALSIAESGMDFLQKAESVYFQIRDGIEKTAVHSLILFLPYKASMWDSMESIYLAARKDPSCEALVMPISYFERAEGGSFGEAQNEREKFPVHIPLITEDFSIEEEQPDLIYIHNPYDDANLVTSVHPRYYSFNLKKYTENLVYVPYFTTTTASNLWRNFLPAFPYVDYIVGQNEVHKNCLPSEVTGKCVVLGNPKFDAAAGLKTKKIELPPAWQEIAKGRSLYYYNTSLICMLENPDGFLRKMEELFRLFKDHPKYCLLWRPHPLLENTFLTMKREFLPRFQQLKEKFITEKIVSYDDSAELDRAIALSALYIGDWGTSITSLFNVAEKPLVMLDYALSSENKERNEKLWPLLQYFLLRFAGIHPQEGEEALVLEGRFLLKGKIEGKTLFLDKLDLADWGLLSEEEKIPGDEYREAYFEHGRWILCPRAGGHFLVLEKGKAPQKVELEHIFIEPDAFYESYREGEYIFCKAENYPCDIRFSLKTLRVLEETGQKEGKLIYHISEEELKKWKVECNFKEEELISGFLPWRHFSYGLQENVAYNLQDFLSDKPLPRPFDKAFSHSKIKEIAVNIGTAGEKIHAYFQRIALQDEKNREIEE